LHLHEEGRVNLLNSLGVQVFQGELLCVVARIEVDFVGELHYPGVVRLGNVVERIGTKSFTLVTGIFEQDRCAVLGRAVIVLLDGTTRRSVALPDAIRQQLTELSIAP